VDSFLDLVKQNNPIINIDFIYKILIIRFLWFLNSFLSTILALDFFLLYLRDSNTKYSLSNEKHKNTRKDCQRHQFEDKNLKHSLKEKLLNTIFFSDPKRAHSDKERAYIYCCKYFFIAKILNQLGARSLSIDLSQKVFNKALKYEQTEFIVYASKLLRNRHISTEPNKTKFLYYNEQYKKFRQIKENN